MQRKRWPLWAGAVLILGGIAGSERWWFGNPYRTILVLAAGAAVALISVIISKGSGHSDPRR